MKILLVHADKKPWATQRRAEALKREWKDDEVDTVDRWNLPDGDPYDVIHFLFSGGITKCKEYILKNKEKVFTTVASNRSLDGKWDNLDDLYDIYRVTRACVAQNHILAVCIRQIGGVAKFIPNGVDTDLFKRDFVVGYVGAKDSSDHKGYKMIEEVLYPAMEQGSLNIIIGKGPGARVIQLDLPPFTLIAATTRIALLSSPLRSRFSGGTHRLEFYTEKEIGEIINRSAKILGVDIPQEGIIEIARRSRFTPRIANHLLKRARDYAEVKDSPLTQEIVAKALDLLGIDKLGLSNSDRAVLLVIADKFKGGPVGLNTIATALAEEEATVEEVYEPYLIQCGFLERTPRGRVITESGLNHLNNT